MKRILFCMLLISPMLTTTTAYACGEGQGNALEINVTTKEVRTYCYDIIQPSQAELEAQAKQRVEQTLVQQANSNPVTQTLDSVVSVSTLADEPEQRPRVLEVNATTGVVTEREYNDVEMAQWRIDQTANQARQQATDLAKANATSGVNACVEWIALNQSGTSCHYEQVPVTQEEIDYQFNFLVELFNPNWFEMLMTWLK